MTDTTPRPPAPRRAPWRRLALGAAWLASLATCAAGTAFVVTHKEGILRRLGRVEMSGVLQSNLYNVGWTLVPAPRDGRYGAIAPLGNGLLHVTNDGALALVDSSRTFRPLAWRVPLNVDEFRTDPYNAGTADQDNFAVKDLLVMERDDRLRILASHNHWDAGKDCYVLRVSMLELTREALLGDATGSWRTVFDSRPCKELGLLNNGQRRPTIGAGGRLAARSADEVLLTVGPFGNEGTAEDSAGAKPLAGDYGKVHVIDLRTGATRIFTSGHRNAQGLAIAPDGRVWETEHAARGGDELNLLEEGKDYGFPRVSYGTAYGMMVWPASGTPGRHEGFTKPMWAWVPSIGVSELVVVGSPRFPAWEGDLLVSSLVGRALHRVRIEEGRTILVEPIAVGRRIRDLAETARGEIVALTEDGFLLYLEAMTDDVGDTSLLPRERGMIVAARCQGCHTFDRGGANGLGPNLHGAVGRRVAAVEGFSYSSALRGLGGRWTEERLRAYLADPGAFAPGTTMAMGFTPTARELDDLLAYLRTLQ